MEIRRPKKKKKKDECLYCALIAFVKGRVFAPRELIRILGTSNEAEILAIEFEVEGIRLWDEVYYFVHCLG